MNFGHHLLRVYEDTHKVAVFLLGVVANGYVERVVATNIHHLGRQRGGDVGLHLGERGLRHVKRERSKIVTTFLPCFSIVQAVDGINRVAPNGEHIIKRMRDTDGISAFIAANVGLTDVRLVHGLKLSVSVL